MEMSQMSGFSGFSENTVQNNDMGMSGSQLQRTL